MTHCVFYSHTHRSARDPPRSVHPEVGTRKVLEVLGLYSVRLAWVSLASLCGTLMSFSPLLSNGLLNLAGTCSNILEFQSRDASMGNKGEYYLFCFINMHILLVLAKAIFIFGQIMHLRMALWWTGHPSRVSFLPVPQEAEVSSCVPLILHRTSSLENGWMDLRIGSFDLPSTQNMLATT